MMAADTNGRSEIRRGGADDALRTPRVDWRELNGATPTDDLGRKLAAGIVPWSSSEGDMGKRSYRKSKYPGAFTRTAVNDDGSPIAEGTNALLMDVLAILTQLTAETAALNAKFDLLLEME